MRALIGYTGFVGSHLMEQWAFDDLYNSKNIQEIRGKEYEIIVCSGAPAVKWLANKEPASDLANINLLMHNLRQCKASMVILISTVDVYKDPYQVDEDTPIEEEALDAYGKNRYILERFTRENFADVHIIRLPGLFGKGLKKNIIYDFMNHNAIEMIRSDNVFQFYDLKRLYQDIHIVLEQKLPLVNFATEPVVVSELAWNVFEREFHQTPDRPKVRYDMRSKYARLFNNDSIDHYLMSAEEELRRMKKFVAEQSGGDK